MTVVRLVRHGRAAAGWDVDPDPPLDDLGRAQAEAVCAELSRLAVGDVVTSPLRRCRETSAPLSTAWGVQAVIVPAVAEIPSPEGIAMADRVGWLREVMAGEWSALGPRYTRYRDEVVSTICALRVDTVVFSHFIAINAVIGAATGDDRMVIRSLDNCSVTTVEVGADGTVRLVEGGREADTLIR